MTIFLDSSSRIVVQGMTGAEGSRHTARMLASGTTVVGGVNPKKSGTVVGFDVRGEDVSLPVFGTVADAVAEGADVSVVFVPRQAAKEAIVEAANAGIRLAVVITEGIPVADVAYACAHAEERGMRIVGPNCPGVISPGRSNAGITPWDITGPGPIGLVSRSGTLTYQMMHELSDIGFTTCVGIGGDPVIGTSPIDCLEAFEADPETELIVLIGEIGGDAEEKAAKFIQEKVATPVVAYIAGFTAPPGRTMGHAGAIVSGGSGTAEAKRVALEAVGVRVGTTPAETAAFVREAMGR